MDTNRFVSIEEILFQTNISLFANWIIQFDDEFFGQRLFISKECLCRCVGSVVFQKSWAKWNII